MGKESLSQGIDGAVAALKALSLRHDFYEAVALSTKKPLDALVKAGFTEEQATCIVCGILVEKR